MGLSTTELAQLRSCAADYLPGTCVILRDTVTTRNTGDLLHSWGTVAGTVSCRIAPTSYQDYEETQQAGLIGGEASCWLSVPYNQDITPADRVVHDSVTYEVMTVETAGSWKVAKRAIVKVVNP